MMHELKCAPWPNYSEAEGDLVRDVLLSNKVNYWTGEITGEFEKQFAAKMDCAYSIAIANGTLALDLAFIALEIGTGDEVIVTPRSFMASASAIHNAGAKPVFADIDPVSQNISVETIKKVITEKTKAINCVHLAGWPCEMDAIKNLAQEKGIFIVEDCAQAHGATFDGKSVGSWGDIAAWSFCQDKIMTTGGEGGMVTTNSPQLFETMWAYKDHGKSRQKMEAPKSNRSFKFVHDTFGSNFRLTEMQSAIGLYQLGLLDDWTKQRTRNAMFYHDALSKLDAVRVPLPPLDVKHAYYKFYFYLKLDQLGVGWDRDRVVEEVNDQGGACFSGSCPELYREKAFVSTYGEQPRLKSAARLGNESLMLACHPGISPEFLEFNLGVIKHVLGCAIK